MDSPAQVSLVIDSRSQYSWHSEVRGLSSRRKRVVFDQTQSERGRLDSTYSQLGQLLRDNDYDVESYTEYMIMAKKLEGIDVFVLACPNSSKLRPAEIDALRKFVQDGGGLMMLSLSGGDKGLMNNMSLLSKNFGIEFDNTAVKDERDNAGLPTLLMITGLVPHAITENAKNILLPSSCTLRLSGKAVVIATTSGAADPSNQPVVAAAEFERGRVICVGSYEVFRRGGGLKNEGNSVFATNCFGWLSGQVHLAKPSQVVAAQAKTEETRAKAAEVTETTQAAETDKTLRRLVNAVIDLQKDIARLAENTSRVEKSIEGLRGQFQDFSEKIQQQLGLMVPAKQFQTEEENRIAEAKADIESIEMEIRSVRQLRDHIEKKLSAGTLTREAYDEQMQKMDERLGSLDRRLAEKKEELEKLTR